MSADFLIDDLKNVWFSYASRIKHRRGSHRISQAEIAGSLHNEGHTKLEIAQQEELEEELVNFRQYEANEKAKKSQPSYQQNQMSAIMNEYYEKKKKEQGIEINYALLETDKDFEAAFKQMRPNCMERNFSEYLKKQT